MLLVDGCYPVYIQNMQMDSLAIYISSKYQNCLCQVSDPFNNYIEQIVGWWLMLGLYGVFLPFVRYRELK